MKDRMKVILKSREVEIRILRMGLNIREFTHKLDVSYYYFMELLRKRLVPARSPSSKLRRKMLEVFKCDFDDIFEIEENK